MEGRKIGLVTQSYFKHEYAIFIEVKQGKFAKFGVLGLVRLSEHAKSLAAIFA